MTALPFNQPFIVGKELYYIAQAVQEGHLSGDGTFTRKCHEWLENTLECRKALLTHSCTGALEMAAILCGIQPGDEVIMPSFTFVSTANAFVLRGGVPVFVDIRSDNMNLDESLVEAAITEKTRAIVCVHYAGVPCAMDEILDIARRHDLLVIEDAAQALLSSYREKPLGSIGDLGCLSFHETKNVISGEGGALLINNPNMIERAEIVWEKGTNRKRFQRGQIDKYSWVDIGSSFLPSELVSAFLFAQLEEAEKIIARRRKAFKLYYDRLSQLEEDGLIRLPCIKDGNAANGHLFFLLARSLVERISLAAHLIKNEITTVFHYIPLHSSQAGTKYGRAASVLPVTDDVSERLLRLPMFFEISDEDILRVTDSVCAFYNRG